MPPSKRWPSPRARSPLPTATAIVARASTCATPRTARWYARRPTIRAALATSGRILLYQGQPAFVFYSAWCGGRNTDRRRRCRRDRLPRRRIAPRRGGESEPAGRATCAPGHRARAEAPPAARRPVARPAGRGAQHSRRVARIRMDGFTPSEMSGHEFRMAVGRVAGFQAIKSTAFDVDRTGTGYHFRGRGFGHGVGLCVVGAASARHAARRRRDPEVLLSRPHGRWNAGATDHDDRTTRTGACGTRTCCTRRTCCTCRTRLSRHRSRCRDRKKPSVARPHPGAAIATRWSRQPAQFRPRALRITVGSHCRQLRSRHRPAVGGCRAPPKARRSTCCRCDSPATRPARTNRRVTKWSTHSSTVRCRSVRCGSGKARLRDFASPPGSRPQPARVTCPKDAAPRPISAGAQREAYTRAEACFAREIADGKRWDQIK